MSRRRLRDHNSFNAFDQSVIESDPQARHNPGMTAAPDPRSIELLQHVASGVHVDEAEEIARNYFGICGAASSLSGERDRNFRIHARDGADCVLKIAHPLEAPQFVEFQTEALRRVADRDPAIPVPRVIAGRDGHISPRIRLRSGEETSVRLATYLSGVPLSERTSSRELRSALGGALARIDCALAGFSHPGADDRLLWNLANAPGLCEFLPCLPDARLRARVGSWLAHFEQDVLPELVRLRPQVIHNDLNPSNVLVDPERPERLTGVIDFGDLVSSYLVVDVAVAAAYQLRYTPDPFDDVTEFVAAYHQECPLDVRELDLLFDLIGTRLALAIVITAWRSGLHPENREYILRNSAVNAEFLRRYENLSRTDIQERLKAACGDAEATARTHPT